MVLLHNWDALSDDILGPAIQTTLTEHKVVISQVLNYVPEQDSDDETEDIQKNEWVDWVSRYTSKEQDPTEHPSNCCIRFRGYCSMKVL